MNSYAIIGAGCGDEGKGLVTNWLCGRSKNPLAIRFSGGAQSGHTVVHNGIRHIFSSFGSGTLRGVPTYWSKYCTVDPIAICNELAQLQSKGVTPELYIDIECPVTTPYDAYVNQQTANKIGHGSCGVGFGNTIEREEHLYSLTFGDLFYPQVFEVKYKNIQDYYGVGNVCPNVDDTEFLKCCHSVTENRCISGVPGIPNQDYSNYIFEGSQGLLLDQHYGFFPNVTRSNTGCRNAVEILGTGNFEVYLVVRAYQTRHGNGFMSNENIPHNIRENSEETNKEHPYQGKFRRSLLDVSLLKYALSKDPWIRTSTWKHLVVTCLDHVVDDYRFTYGSDNHIVKCRNEKDFLTRLSSLTGIADVYASHSAESDNITHCIL